MKITIEVIPHKKQRYDTVGDWFWTNEGKPGEELTIRVSNMKDRRYVMLVAMHELAEVMLCREAGVTQAQVDEFDMEFEKQRKNSITLLNAEPGDNRFAPYQEQHCIATGIERILAAAMGVKWQDYETELNSL
jgi:hypothetical protein